MGELVSTNKTRYLVKLTGDIEVDVMSNLKEVLRRELKNDEKFKMGAIEIYDTDTELVPRFPAICLDITNSMTSQLTIGNICTYRRDVSVDIWYYHADVIEKASESAVRIAASRIVSVIHRNADINGYCRMGVRMLNPGRFADKVFGSKVVRGFVMPIQVPILYRDKG